MANDAPDWEWDTEAGAGYLDIDPDCKDRLTETVSDDGKTQILIDRDRDGMVVGIEVLR
jgi:uncharacterized protein YuzE